MPGFLFCAWPFPGHVHPHIAVGAALRARGHRVAFYTHSPMRELVEAEGFTVFPYEGVDEASWNTIRELERQTPVGLPVLRRGFQPYQRWLVDTIPGQVADLEQIIGAWQPDVLVTEPMFWGPILVLHETSPLPVAVSSFTLGCALPGSDVPPGGVGLPPPRTVRTRLLARLLKLATDVALAGPRRRIDQIRGRYGLSPLGCSVSAFTARLPLYIVPSIRELDYNRRDLPPSVHYVGPCVWNRPSTAPPPAWLAELPRDRPLVHVTEGTAHHQEPFLLRAAAQAFADQPVEVVLTTGRDRDPAALGLGSVAPNIRVERWVSHADLLPRCAAIVTTGGAGTVLAAVEAGVPQVVVPTLWDKADNAQRAVEAGVGLRLSPRACTPERLRAAVERVLREPHFRLNAQRLAEGVRAAPGPPRAAELLEALALRTASRVGAA